MVSIRFSARTALLCAGLTVAAAAHAPAVRALCTAAEVIAAKPGCPASGPCLIDGSAVTVDNGCTLDFSGRAVSLRTRIIIGSGMATLLAGSFTVLDATSTFIDGRAPLGGSIVIRTTGDVQGLGRSDAINVDGTARGGTILIEAGGNVSFQGNLLARGTTSAAGGGFITIRAGGNFSNASTSLISVAGGSTSSGGGLVDITTDGSATLNGPINLRGSDGGSLDLFAIGAVTITEIIDASPLTASDAGSGGEANIQGRSIQLSAPIRADGTAGTLQSGGCGGFVCLLSVGGNIVVAGEITADGISPDGGGGEISVDSRGTLRLQSRLSARARGTEGCGGGINLGAGTDITVTSAGSVISSAGGTGAGGLGGGTGGDIELIAGRNIEVNGLIDAAGKSNDTSGGTATLLAGIEGSGMLTLANTIDVRGGGCSIEFCSLGGTVDLDGCDVTVAAACRLLATGSEEGGANTIAAREQLRIAGTLDARGSIAAARPGTNALRFPSRKAPIITGTVQPAATQTSLATCVFPGQTNPPCQDPCPVCGNGRNEFPETCDDGMNPPRSCDGCSLFCRTESCDDGNVCTTNSCNPDFGCYHEPIAGCTPPPTPTPTRPTPTVTQTFTLTPTSTPTQTPVPCVGDCNGDGMVSITELVIGVNIALGKLPLGECPTFDLDGNGILTIDELMIAVRGALIGCA
jgi:cysteine-rich repeat protein